MEVEEEDSSHATGNDTSVAEDMVQSMRPISRLEILQRAVVWLANSFEYKFYNYTQDRPRANLEGCAEASVRAEPTDCPRPWNAGDYLSDCSGFVGMAWKTTTRIPAPIHFKSPTVSKQINCKDLRPGDAILVGTSHIILFREWRAGSPGKGPLEYTGWQMGGEKGKANRIYAKITSETCHCRLGLKDGCASSSSLANLLV
jgi:hypothetical protein